MKSIISKTVVCLGLAVILYSFSSRPGGEGFEIYIGKTLLYQQFSNKANAKSLQLPSNASGEEMYIKYYQCGQIGKGRTITLRDQDNNLLSEFHYADVSSHDAAMSLKVKEIVKVQKGDEAVKMYYSSKELPRGRFLADIKP